VAHPGGRVAALALIIVPLAVQRARSSAVPARPVVAVVQVRNVTADTSDAWLEEGLRQMIATALARSEAVEVIASSRIRDVITRRDLRERYLPRKNRGRSRVASARRST